MKIVSIVSQLEYTPDQKRKLQAIGEFIEHKVRKLNPEDKIKHIGDADILLVGPSGVEEINSTVLKQCKNLKMISTLSVGVNYIDVKTAKDLGIIVSNFKGGNSESVAEHVWGMILGLSKKIIYAHIDTSKGNTTFDNFEGVELQGKTIGIIGFGEIGSRVARVAKGFDMKILVNSRTKREIPEVSFVELDDLIKNSDVIVVAVPLDEKTNKLLNSGNLKFLKDRSILVSISRDDVIDKDALIKKLSDGTLFGVGLDIDINTAADKRFYNFDNVIITPHTAFFTTESELRCNDMGVDNIVAFVNGNPTNVVC